LNSTEHQIISNRTIVALKYSTIYGIISTAGNSNVSKLDKKINRLRENPKNVSSRELKSILHSLGFELRGGKGSHECFKHPRVPEVKITVPKQTPLKKVYVIQALNVINKLMELEDYE
jgi:predicted RNA binding protein YcfA (HicA-like mRNA interferase family)